MRYVVVGLGNIGQRRRALLGERCVATADPFNDAADYRSVRDVPDPRCAIILTPTSSRRSPVMRITTTTCHRHSHPEFVLEADDAHVPDVYLKDLADTIEQMVAAGSVFRPGETYIVLTDAELAWKFT